MAGETPGEFTAEEQVAIQAIRARVLSGDHYAVLGVSPGADPGHIRKAYYALSRSWHPDQFYRRPIGEWRERIDEVFAGINRSYQVLSDPESRAAYDAERELEAAGRPAVVIEPAPIVPTSAGESRVVVPERSDDSIHEVDLSRDRLKVSPASVTSGVSSIHRGTRWVPGMGKIKSQVVEQLTKARRAYRKALAEAKEERWIQAAADMYIATRFDPANAEYERLWREYDPKGRVQTAQQYLSLAQSSLQYHDSRSALAHLEAAVAVNPPMGDPYFALGTFKDQADEDRDPREIMNLFRKAVDKSPDSVRFRLALARIYMECRLQSKARREYEEVLRLEPDNAEAKAGLKKAK